MIPSRLSEQSVGLKESALALLLSAEGKLAIGICLKLWTVTESVSVTFVVVAALAALVVVVPC